MTQEISKGEVKNENSQEWQIKIFISKIISM